VKRQGILVSGFEIPHCKFTMIFLPGRVLSSTLEDNFHILSFEAYLVYSFRSRMPHAFTQKNNTKKAKKQI